MARVSFESCVCSGSVDIGEEVAKAFEVPLTQQQADDQHTFYAPEAGGEVKVIDYDGLRRAQLLGAAYYEELLRLANVHPEHNAELATALLHAKTAAQWARVAFRKNRAMDLPPPPPPPSPLPTPRQNAKYPRAQRKR